MGWQQWFSFSLNRYFKIVHQLGDSKHFLKIIKSGVFVSFFPQCNPSKMSPKKKQKTSIASPRGRDRWSRCSVVLDRLVILGHLLLCVFLSILLLMVFLKELFAWNNVFFSTTFKVQQKHWYYALKFGCGKGLGIEALVRFSIGKDHFEVGFG